MKKDKSCRLRVATYYGVKRMVSLANPKWFDTSHGGNASEISPALPHGTTVVRTSAWKNHIASATRNLDKGFKKGESILKMSQAANGVTTIKDLTTKHK